MKILNNDIKELDAWLLHSFHTCWYNLKIDILVEENILYLKNKYKTSLSWLDNYITFWINYLNNQNEQDYVDFFKYTKDLFIKNFWEEKGLVFYIKFTFSLMDDWEHYSKVINWSKIINELLLIDYKSWFKYYAKNHKYEIGKPIFWVSRNLWKSIEWLNNSDLYDFWETYNPD